MSPVNELAKFPSIKDKQVFVSGGGSGIGESIVEAFAQQGAKVAFVDIAVDRVAAYRFFNIHAGKVAEQHRGRAQLRLAERHHRKFEWKAAGFQHAALDELGQLAKVAVAGRQFGPGIADADDGAAVELIVRVSVFLGPAAMHEAVAILLAEPCLAATFCVFCGHNLYRGEFKPAFTHRPGNIASLLND